MSGPESEKACFACVLREELAFGPQGTMPDDVQPGFPTARPQGAKDSGKAISARKWPGAPWVDFLAQSRCTPEVSRVSGPVSEKACFGCALGEEPAFGPQGTMPHDVWWGFPTACPQGTKDPGESILAPRLHNVPRMASSLFRRSNHSNQCAGMRVCQNWVLFVRTKNQIFVRTFRTNKTPVWHRVC